AETPTAAWTAQGTDAGTYPVGIQSADFSLKTKNFSNVVFDIKDGSLVIGPKSIVDDPDHFQVGNVEDKVYNGKDQFVEPVVTDLDVQGLARAAGTQLVNGTDYTLSYNNKLDYKNVTGNPVTVTVTGKGNYTGQITRSYKILTAPLDVMTPSATKVYDGSPLTATAGTLTGLVNGEKVKFTVTGSQTAVGSSKNTYKIDWDDTKSTNYKLTEAVGTLTVTSVTPGPTPTPPGPPIIPTPTPVPPAPPVVPPVQPVVVPDDNTPAAPATEIDLTRVDELIAERGEYGLRSSYCVLHIFILLLAAVVEAFLLVKVKKDNQELEDELTELEESGANV
ncbi:MAG: hypothetical protein HUJ57_03565, partial [Erysipelotrichaceae bacterium]|nr:hypothetical protein [Erysipelotrichaceae bacterium]